MDVTAIRGGLKTRLATISGARTYDSIPAKPELPALIVTPLVTSSERRPFITYQDAMQRGLATMHFEVVVLVSMAQGFDRAQKALDGYLSSGSGSTKSISDALDGDRSLGGAASDAHLVSAFDYGELQTSQGTYASVKVLINVLAPRT